MCKYGLAGNKIELPCSAIDGASICGQIYINIPINASDKIQLKIFPALFEQTLLRLPKRQLIDHQTFQDQEGNKTLLNDFIASWPYEKCSILVLNIMS